jgi:hypothetical protein
MDTSTVRTVVLQLVSHACGELVEMLARSAVVQLQGVPRHLPSGTEP